MKFSETFIKGNFVISLETKQDERGFFIRNYCERQFADEGLNTKWVQTSSSINIKTGTLRGLHFQRNPSTEIKLIRCIKGSIWDVIVDLRVNSKTFGKWFGIKLSDKNYSMMYVPKGLAHGFISLEDNSEILYFTSEFYNPRSEEILLWNDKNININWPIPPVIISKKDKNGKTLKEIKPI